MIVSIEIALSFIGLTLICLWLIDRAIQHQKNALATQGISSISNHYRLYLLAWLLLLSVGSLSGFFSDFSGFPPKMALALFTPLIFLLLLWWRAGHGLQTLLAAVPASWTIYIQSFRLIVEILLWRLFITGHLPERMTFEGANFDILAGITAPLVAFWWIRQKRYAWAFFWNLAGLGLLCTIVGIALLTMPSPFRVFFDAENTVIATFPIIFLPAVLVPIAYYCHSFSLWQCYQLWKEQKHDS